MHTLIALNRIKDNNVRSNYFIFMFQNCGDDRDPKLNISYISIKNPLNLQHIELSGFKRQYEETIHSNRFHSFHDVGLTVAIAAVCTHSVFV